MLGHHRLLRLSQTTIVAVFNNAGAVAALRNADVHFAQRERGGQRWRVHALLLRLSQTTIAAVFNNAGAVAALRNADVHFAT